MGTDVSPQTCRLKEDDTLVGYINDNAYESRQIPKVILVFIHFKL